MLVVYIRRKLKYIKYINFNLFKVTIHIAKLSMIFQIAKN